MKSLRTGVFLSLFLGALIFSPAQAAEGGLLDGILSTSGIEVSGDVAFNSIYMWRGIMLDGDAVVQPGFYVRSPESKYGRIKVGIWLNHDLQNKDSLRSSETDYLFDYTYSFSSVALSTGFTYYDFPDAAPSDGAPRGFSREVYGGITFTKLPASRYRTRLSNRSMAE